MKTKVIHLHLNEPHNGETDFYFGSLKAIYDLIPYDTIRISYKALTNAIHGKTEYTNKRCTIRIRELIRKEQSKNNAT